MDDPNMHAYGDEHYWDDRDEEFDDEPVCPCCGGDGPEDPCECLCHGWPEDEDDYLG